MKKEGMKIPKFEIDKFMITKECKKKLASYGCPAIVITSKEAYIDEDLCTGCGMCASLCPGVIKVKQ